MNAHRGPLSDVLVVERAGRLAVAACGHLLAALGARVVRIETESEVKHAAEATKAIRRLMQGGKEIVALRSDRAEEPRALASWLEAASVVLSEPVAGSDPLSLEWRSATGTSSSRVVCMISPEGLESREMPANASDALLQAACGLMAVTGQNEDGPEYVRVPVTELTGAVVALSAVLAALRVLRRDGVGQLVDISLVEAMADQLRTHVGLAGAGETRGFRIGCRHPLCSPWNVYRARDGWVMICSASDANWQAVLKEIGRPDLARDERYSRAAIRARHSGDVDALMQEWIAPRTIEEVVASMTAVDVPAGPALEPRQVPDDAFLRSCGTVPTDTGPAPRLAFRLSRSALAGLGADTRLSDAMWSRGDPALRVSTARAPLEGIRVVELTRYAAGPLAGYLLSSLGAEVIKIEPPGGEETRTWKPRFGSVSGYFANFNAGKRCVCLDLKKIIEHQRLRELVAGADVLLHNMRPGAMERLGLGADTLTRDFPKLVYCAISGYGMQGPKLAALDTVIQARLGLTALVGDGRTPLRIGYSIADQLAGHYAASGVLAALADRDTTGLGQIVDVSMADAMAWLTHLAWTRDGAEEALSASRVGASDGWVMANASADAIECALGVGTPALTRADIVRRLAARGIAAAAVLEVDEVLEQPALRSRGSVYYAASGAGRAPVFVAPYGLTATPVRRAAAVADVAQDNERVFELARA